MYMRPFTTSRMITVRLPPPVLPGGISGSTSPHSSSVRSLGYPSRSARMSSAVVGVSPVRPAARGSRGGSPNLWLCGPPAFRRGTSGQRQLRLLATSLLFKRLAGELGFEPRQTESESVVLPLHHSPMNCSVFNTLRNSVRQSLAIGVLQKIPPRCSVFYSLAPGLGKRRHRPFLRNNCRQLRGAVQCSAHERLRSAKSIAIRLLTLDGRFSRAPSRLSRGGRLSQP